MSWKDEAFESSFKAIKEKMYKASKALNLIYPEYHVKASMTFKKKSVLAKVSGSCK